MSDKKKKIIDFKRYLKKDNPLTGKLYFGEEDHEVDEGFEAAVKLLEKKISKAIDRSIEGQLWSASGFNYDASLQDVKTSINLIVNCQASLDAIGPYEDHQMYDRPSAMNFSNTPPGYLEEADPDQSQRQGVQDQKIPKDVLSDLNQDERFIQLMDLMNSQEK